MKFLAAVDSQRLKNKTHHGQLAQHQTADRHDCTVTGEHSEAFCKLKRKMYLYGAGGDQKQNESANSNLDINSLFYSLSLLNWPTFINNHKQEMLYLQKCPEILAQNNIIYFVLTFLSLCQEKLTFVKSCVI